MKKAIIAALASAFIIPGLGQVLNQQLKKGLIILGIVFILFLAGTIKLVLIVMAMAEGQSMDNPDPVLLMERLWSGDYTVIWILVLVFAVLWIYSIIDAFKEGKKIESRSGDETP